MEELDILLEKLMIVIFLQELNKVSKELKIVYESICSKFHYFLLLFYYLSLYQTISYI
jgi:hypothetical protein